MLARSMARKTRNNPCVGRKRTTRDKLSLVNQMYAYSHIQALKYVSAHPGETTPMPKCI